jgi:site-specific DNA-methyltransferase (adenine-specific)
MTPLDRNLIMVGDATEQLRRMPTASIDCVVTSPPYFQLRNYGVAGQIGLEPTVEQWVDELRAVFGEVARVLKPSGSLWLNLGDSYSRGHSYGAAPKSLLLAPERLLLALAADGWIVRNKAVWAKSNPMPSSVTDRLNTTYDVVYFLVRSPRYFFDLDAIREPHRSKGNRSARTASSSPPAWAGPLAGTQGGLARPRADGLPGHRLGKNPGDVWRLPASSYRGAHFATFPEILVERPLLATCPERVCTGCGEGWQRAAGEVVRLGSPAASGRDPYVRRYPSRWQTVRALGRLVACACGAPALPGVVLDPFFGSGTVGVVAQRLGRDWIGIELNPTYAELARARLSRRARTRDEVAA